MTQPSIVDLLKKEHRGVHQLLLKAMALDEHDGVQRVALFDALSDALRAHIRFGDDHLYPLIGTHQPADGPCASGAPGHEHGLMLHLLADIGATAPSDQRWQRKLKLLAQCLHQHVTEEEQRGGVFDRLRRRLPPAELRALGVRLPCAGTAA